MAVHARKVLLWVVSKLVSALIFTGLAAAWFVVPSLLFTFSGLRAHFYGAGDFWIAAMTIAFVILMVPVFIGHKRIMRRIRARGSADGQTAAP